MVTQAGIWMDYSKAVVVLLRGDEVDLTVIESNARAERALLRLLCR